MSPSFRPVTKKTIMSLLKLSTRAGIRSKTAFPFDGDSHMTVWQTDDTVFWALMKKRHQTDEEEECLLAICSVEEADVETPTLP